MKTKKISLVFMLMLTGLLVSCSAVSDLFATPTPTATITPILTPTPSPTPFPHYGKSLKDVTYCTMAKLPQQMDIYFPDQGGPWPVVYYIHGGSWTTGDKIEAGGLAQWLNPLGYVVVSVNYRMYPTFYFPAYIEDPKCGVRFLRAHAAGYNLDPNRFAAMGASAGGHLAALLGTADESAGWDVGEYLDQSSRVQAVVDIAGPANLAAGFEQTGLESTILLGFDNVPAGTSKASPVTYATSDDPPFLILHGDKDGVVPGEQGQIMYDALIKAGAQATLVIIKNAGHDISVAVGPGPTIPNTAEINQILLDFLEKALAVK